MQKVSVYYGSWNKKCKIHALIIEDGIATRRLCDNKRPVNNWGNAGDLNDVTCKKCLKELKKGDYVYEYA